ALAQIETIRPGVIVVCERRHPGTLMPLNEHIAALNLSTRIVVLVQRSGVRSATAALRLGAGDYIGMRESSARLVDAVRRLLPEHAPPHAANTAKASDEKNDAAYLALLEEYNSLRSQMRDRDDFLSLVSHEFRTPLMAVNGYLELLKK